MEATPKGLYSEFDSILKPKISELTKKNNSTNFGQWKKTNVSDYIRDLQNITKLFDKYNSEIKKNIKNINQINSDSSSDSDSKKKTKDTGKNSTGKSPLNGNLQPKEVSSKKLLDTYKCNVTKKVKVFEKKKSNEEEYNDEYSSSIVDHTDFEPIKILGKGGFALVYLVNRKGSSNKFALKLLTNKSDYESDWIDKMRREFDALREISLLDSPYVVKYHYFAQLYKPNKHREFMYYMVLEYVNGSTMTEFLNKYEELTELQIFFIFHDIFKGLSLVHNTGFAHRDMKPDNILFDEVESFFKVTDFTGAKFLGEDDSSEVTSKIGTNGYMPYEVYSQTDIDFKKADNYSLGIMLHYCVVRKLRKPKAVNEKYFLEVNRKLLKDLDKYKVEDNLKELITNLIAFNPEERYSLEEVFKSEYFVENKEEIDNLIKTHNFATKKELFEHLFENKK